MSNYVFFLDDSSIKSRFKNKGDYDFKFSDTEKKIDQDASKVIFLSFNDSSENKAKHLSKNESSKLYEQLESNDELKNKIKKQFLKVLEKDEIEFGKTSLCEEFIIESMHESASLTKEAINDLYIESVGHVKTLTAILIAIAHIDYEIISPNGQLMAMAAFSHSNLEVRECAVRAFEYWGNIESLKILEQTNLEPKWLQNYLEEVTEDLREELNVQACTENK